MNLVMALMRTVDIQKICDNNESYDILPYKIIFKRQSFIMYIIDIIIKLLYITYYKLHKVSIACLLFIIVIAALLQALFFVASTAVATCIPLTLSSARNCFDDIS